MIDAKSIASPYQPFTTLHPTIRDPNPLIVAASFYSPNLSATFNKRRPKHILHDPDDQITTDNATRPHNQPLHSVFAGEDEVLDF
ncbi:jg1454 [Pararge aegeria aegeria]|uniref:Jg1454 protein n=1 Tax=Pararge aegeria aegeria TaxID=348720 RepID=A0A8S4QH27_9NEOP|nr:jg1454 [Pararge aegeria aegeria]